MHKSYSIKMRVEFFASMGRGKGGGLMEEEKVCCALIGSFQGFSRRHSRESRVQFCPHSMDADTP